LCAALHIDGHIARHLFAYYQLGNLYFIGQKIPFGFAFAVGLIVTFHLIGTGGYTPIKLDLAITPSVMLSA
jgi:hypothetical protein